MFIRAFLIWLLLAVIAIAAGTLRTALLLPAAGEQAAHVAGTLAVVAIFAAVIRLATPWIVPGPSRGRLLRLSAGWVAATAAFEFGFGHYIAGHPWSRLLADYNLFRGRIWILVLVTLFAMPLISGKRRATGPEE